MIFLIGGIFFGITVVALATAHVSLWLVLLGSLWPIALIAPGIQNLTGNDPNKALEAIQRVQHWQVQQGKSLPQLSAEQIRRIPELVSKSNQSLSEAVIRQLQEQAQRYGHTFGEEE